MPVVRGGYQPGVQTTQSYQGGGVGFTRWAVDKDEVVVGYKQLPDGRQVSWFHGRKGVALRILCVLVIFSIGLVVGMISKRMNTVVFPSCLKHDTFEVSYDFKARHILGKL